MITLTVDDQEEVTSLMKRMLTKIDPDGVHMTALNMNDAFDLMSEEVQIVFLDIELPGLNGLEAANILQKNINDLILFSSPVIQNTLFRHTEHIRVVF